MRFLLVAIWAAVLGGCVVNPVTGVNEFSLISPEKEIAIGEQRYKQSQQMQGGLYYIDPQLQAYIARVGQKLARVSDRPELPYEFVVLNNTVPNAWALPGGKIAINRGLLVLLEDESELAAVLAHEIVHAAARHGAAQMTQSTMISLGGQLVAKASEVGGYGGLGGQVAQWGGAAWLAKYGRDDELESDHYGMTYMSRAGYSPEGAVRLQETFVKLSKNKHSADLFASHPPSQERVAANKARLAQLPYGEAFKARYQQRIAQIKRDQRAYELQDKAMIALQKQETKKALALLDQAIALQPAESAFWEARGFTWEQLQQFDKAQADYSVAINKAPDYFKPVLRRGLLRFQQGNKTGAKADLNASFRLLPTSLAAKYLRALEENARPI